MAPFESSLSGSRPYRRLLLLLVPVFLAIGLLWWNQRTNPERVFSDVQVALRAGDWEKTMQLSDEATAGYLASLDAWVWTGQMTELEALSSFEQFLVFTTRCRVLGDGSTRPELSSLLGIWIEALGCDLIVTRSKIINRYTSGQESVGQLYNLHTRIATGIRVAFKKEDDWKLQTMALLKEVYDRASLEGNYQLLREANRNYFANGFSNQHLMPLKLQFEENL